MMDGNKLLITNIQRMCMHDGPGIRTTVFLKGCNLHCPWCANPENIRFKKEKYTREGKVDVYGKEYSIEEAFKEIVKDKKFYGDDGGVTFSGGEPLVHMPTLQLLMRMLKKEQIHIAVETALFVSEEQLKTVLPYVDLFIVDMKILLPQVCKEVIGSEVSIYQRNLEILLMQNKQLIIRIPCNWEYTMCAENKELILKWCKGHWLVPVEIFAIHTLGKTKYESLGLESKGWKKVSEADLEVFAEEIRSCGNDVTVKKI